MFTASASTGAEPRSFGQPDITPGFSSNNAKRFILSSSLPLSQLNAVICATNLAGQAGTLGTADITVGPGTWRRLWLESLCFMCQTLACPMALKFLTVVAN